MAWNKVFEESKKIPGNAVDAAKSLAGTAKPIGSGAWSLTKGIGNLIKTLGKVANSVLAWGVGLAPRAVNFALTFVKARPIFSIVTAAVAGTLFIASSNKKSTLRAQEAEASALQERIAETRAQRMQNFSGPETPTETHFQTMVKSGQKQGIAGAKTISTSPQPVPHGVSIQ